MNLKIKLIFFVLFLITSCNQKKSSAKISKLKQLFSIESYQNLNENEKIIKTDSLAELLKNLPNDSLTRSFYFKIASRYYSIDQMNKYFAISKKALKLSEEANDSLNIAKNCQSVGNYYFDQFKTDSSFYYHTKAESIYKKIGTKVDLSDVLITKANLLYYEKDFAGAETAAIAVLTTAKENKDYQSMYNCNLLLGKLLSGIKNYSQSNIYFNRALSIATTNLLDYNTVSVLKASPMLEIGINYQSQKQQKQAIDYFNKILKLDDFKITSPLMYSHIIDFNAYSQLKLGNKNAVINLKKAAFIRDSVNFIPSIVTSNIHLAEYYLFVNDTAKSLSFINKAKTSAHQFNIFEDELKCLDLLLKIDPNNTVFYSKRLLKLSDSLQDNERNVRNKFARIEFETDQIIKEKNEILINNKLQQYQLYGAVMIITVLIFAGFVLFYINNQRNKLKTIVYNQTILQSSNDLLGLLQEQQVLINDGKIIEKKRISQELHDGVVGRLTGVRFNLYELKHNQNPSTIANCLLQAQTLQEIELELRNITHDLINNIITDQANVTNLIRTFVSTQLMHSTIKEIITVDADFNWDDVDDFIKINIYRIIQEALQNTVKYSQAKTFSIIISRTINILNVMISDDGIGFNDTNKNTNKGIGLNNINNRIKAINGNIDIETAINHGVKIGLSIPIKTKKR